MPVERRKTLCPFHADSHPSMVIYDGNGGYHCYACGAHGDVIDFVRNYENVNLADACRRLNELFSLGLPIDRPMTIRQHRKAQNASREQEERRRERDKLLHEYLQALDRYSNLDGALRDYAPKDAESTVPDIWLDALRNIGFAEFKLKQAEWRLIDYDDRRQHDCFDHKPG